MEKKRIALLAQGLKVAGGLSVGLNIIDSLVRLAPNCRFLVFVPKNVGYERFETYRDSIELRYVGSKNAFGRLLFEGFGLKKELRKFAPEVVVALGNIGLASPPCQQFVLLQDAHFVYPFRSFPGESLIYYIKRLFLRNLLSRCLGRTDALFVQTFTMKKRVVDTYGFPESSISVVPNAISRFVDDAAGSSVPAELETCKDKFKCFALSKYYGHKNLERIVEMFRRYGSELDDVVVVLTVDSAKCSRARRLLREIEVHKLGKFFINVGPIPQERVADFFRSSDLLLFPTLLESFSATYLEAMRFGCPVLTSDMDFAREICGDAAIFIDPWDVDDLFRGLVLCRDDKRLRADLISRGRDRVERYYGDWDSVVLDMIKRIGL